MGSEMCIRDRVRPTQTAHQIKILGMNDTCLTPSYVPDMKWSPQNLQNSVASVARSSLLILANQAVRRSKLPFWASISRQLRESDNILCPSLCSNDLSSQTPHKSSTLRGNFKITFKSVLGHMRFVLMFVLQFARSRDVTSLLKWEWKFGVACH